VRKGKRGQKRPQSIITAAAITSVLSAFSPATGINAGKIPVRVRGRARDRVSPSVQQDLIEAAEAKRARRSARNLAMQS